MIEDIRHSYTSIWHMTIVFVTLQTVGVASCVYGAADGQNLVISFPMEMWTPDAHINGSMFDIMHALVGDSKTGTRIGGIALEFFKQK